MQQNDDWNPRSSDVLNDARAKYDDMRLHCPVAYSDYLQWSIFRHTDIIAIVSDDKTFSNQVSRHLSVPNGMDPPVHGVYRALINPYFSEQSVRQFAPTCQAIAERYSGDINHGKTFDFMAEFAWPVAVAMQCAFLGWPDLYMETLSTWVKKNQLATLQQDRRQLAVCAKEFEMIVSDIVENHQGQDNVTGRLLQEQVAGQPLSREELISIFRNWAVGEIGTMAAAMGIVLQFLVEHMDIQQQLRNQEKDMLDAISEILRLHGPLVTNRRKTTCSVKLSGREIPAGSTLSLNWVSGNRDENIFDQADTFRWGRDHGQNLLYGAGIHACPGAGLANMELTAVLYALLSASKEIKSAGDNTVAFYPSSGYATLPVRMLN